MSLSVSLPLCVPTLFFTLTPCHVLIFPFDPKIQSDLLVIYVTFASLFSSRQTQV